MNNYYAEFNLNKDDSLESIRDSLFKEKKKWANRANNPNMETRQKAEQKLQLLEEAALVFSDKYKKEEYDSELSKSRDSATQTQQQPVQQEQYTAKEVVVEEEEQDEFDMDLTQNDFDTPVDTINTDDINMDGMDW